MPTLFLLILDGIAGAALARSQGRAAWERFNRPWPEAACPPARRFDGAMIILGGALLLAPGFITDVIGFALLIPPTRALFRGLIARFARRPGARSPAPSSARLRPPACPRAGGAPGGSSRRGYDYEGSAREVTDTPRDRGR